MVMGNVTPAFERLRAEVLGRVMPALRHKMFGKLQPIALLSQILSKKLTNGSADQTYVHTQVDEIKLNARLLTGATQNLFTWIMDDGETRLPANDVLEECLDLLKMECHTGHLQISNHLSSTQLLPVREARVLLCATILQLADKQGQDKTLEIRSAGAQIQLRWNSAVTQMHSPNAGMLSHWGWIEDISPLCRLTLTDAGLDLHFPEMT